MNLAGAGSRTGGAVMDEERAWIDRAEAFGKRAVMHPEVVREWSGGCSEEERKFFERLWIHRATADNVAPGVPAPRYVLGSGAVFSELSQDAQYLLATACKRIWGHVE
jgi:hypothetical protein